MRRVVRGLRRHGWRVAVGLLLAVLLAGAGLYAWLLHDLPDPADLEDGRIVPSTRIYDRHGRVLYEIVDLYEGSHAFIGLDELPACIVQATVATEDANFYSHPGVDVVGVARALWLNLRGGEVLAGGSTITQQVARNLLLEDERAERSLRRKLREMILALELNRRYTRNEILELYLNQSYYGNLSYGIESAAQNYFGHSARSLSLAQCALLAGLPQAPATYNPLTHPDIAAARQDTVLGLMHQVGYITQAERNIARDEDMRFAAAGFDIQAPHFVAAVWTQLERDYGAALLSGGLEVTTTIDLDWQNAAQEIAQRHLGLLNDPPDGGPSRNANNAALVAIDPYTGHILTMLGSPDYFDARIDGNVNAALAPRQPGSALKPFTFAATFDPALDHPWTPATMIMDIGTPFVTRRLESYTPSNFSLTEHGPVLIREALASSYNIPAVVALDHVGVQALIGLGTRLGISTLTDSSRYDLALTLGGGEVMLSELTAAYGAFANGGQRVDPVYILEVRDGDGNILYEWTPTDPGTPELDPRVAYLITSILSDENARYPSFGHGSALNLGARPAAAKTGTTTDFRDNWTVGYTPNLVVGVWVGNADNTPMDNVSGISGAGPIWNQFMRSALQGQPYLSFDVPDGLTRAQVCAVSGLLPTPDCPQRQWEWFIEGTTPTEQDTFYQAFEIDRRTGLLADDATPAADRLREVFLVLPPEARDWAARQGIPAPPIGARTVGYDAHPVRLLNPDPYTVFQITPFTPYETQRIRLQTATPSDTIRVRYLMDGELLATSEAAPFEVWWALTPGPHELQAVATLASGETVTSEAVPFRVNSWVPPGERPVSGEAE